MDNSINKENPFLKIDPLHNKKKDIVEEFLKLIIHIKDRKILIEINKLSIMPIYSNSLLYQ